MEPHDHDCGRMKEALADYLEGEVDSELCRQLQQHLEHCEDCRVVVDTTRKTIQFYSRQRPFDLPAEVQQRLQAALKARLDLGD